MNFSFIAGTPLFQGYTENDIKDLARQLRFRTARYPKGSVILSEGEVVTHIGLVLTGSVRLEHNDMWGNTMILGIVESGGVFAEAYACIPNEPLLINVMANENCEILLLSVPLLFSSYAFPGIQSRLIQNLVRISAQKNLQLSRRSLHTTPKSVRGRLLSYFSEQVSAQNSRSITIPFDRQQLADYLNLDRTALSKELGKMHREGLLDYHKNCFVLLPPDTHKTQ